MAQIVLETLPENAQELRAYPGFTLTDPNLVAALSVAALMRFPADRDAAIEMLNVLKGPKPLTPFEIQFIRDRFMDGKDYVIRSYFQGATPENDYQPDIPYTLTIEENPYSRQNEGYLVLHLPSGGADHPRQIELRLKPSTGEWFLWSFESILAGVRVPKALDPWA